MSHITISTNRCQCEFHVISCEEIRSVKRYIVIIDDMLSWKDHIDM